MCYIGLSCPSQSLLDSFERHWPIWVCMLFLDLNQVIYLSQEYHRNGAMLFSVHHIRRHIMSIYPIAGDINSIKVAYIYLYHL